MFGITWGNDHRSTKNTTTNEWNDEENYRRGDYDTTALLTELGERTSSFNLEEVIASSNERAAADTAGAVGNIFRQYRETALPEIFNTQTQTGTFSGSTAQLMANDAFARTANQAAELQLGVASSYINQSLQARDQLISQFGQLLAANLEQSGNVTRSGTGTQKSKGFEWGGNVQASYGMNGGGAGGLTGGGGR
jgi:hypothetical protein